MRLVRMVRHSGSAVLQSFIKKINVDSVSMLYSHCNVGFHAPGHIRNEIKP